MSLEQSAIGCAKRAFGAARILALFIMPLAQAGDPVRGAAIYFNDATLGPCSLCHGEPIRNRLQILNGANNVEPIKKRLVLSIQDGSIKAMPPARDIDDLATFLGTQFAPMAPPGARAAQTAVEYYHADYDHYFVTADPLEQADLDGGRRVGWTRTGRAFKAWTSAADAPASATSVCRFYIPPKEGDSHFLSASPSECAQVGAKFPTFVYESPAVMFVFLPDVGSGGCPGGTAAVMRLWNDPGSRGRIDNNHRLVTDTALRSEMLALGYKQEGYGPLGVSMCAPLQ
jgi:hypothetical protein